MKSVLQGDLSITSGGQCIIGKPILWWIPAQLCMSSTWNNAYNREIAQETLCSECQCPDEWPPHRWQAQAHGKTSLVGLRSELWNSKAELSPVEFGDWGFYFQAFPLGLSWYFQDQGQLWKEKSLWIKKQKISQRGAFCCSKTVPAYRVSC